MRPIRVSHTPHRLQRSKSGPNLKMVFERKVESSVHFFTLEQKMLPNGYSKCLSCRSKGLFLTLSPHFSPEGKMIARRFVFTRGFLTERNTGCISEGRKFLVGTKIKRGLVILVRNAG